MIATAMGTRFDPQRKIVPLGQLVDCITCLKQQGAKIITVNGLFDILTRQHTEYLAQAKKQGNVLVVGVISNRLVRDIKPTGRLLNGEGDRAYVVAGLGVVDYVYVCDSLNWTSILIEQTL